MFDVSGIGVTGCSRWGKGAFTIGVFDDRIALTIPQEPSTGGDPALRIMDKLPGAERTDYNYNGLNWLSDNFAPFVFANNTSNAVKLPIDTHALIGMIAPRGLLVLENPHQTQMGAPAGHMATHRRAARSTRRWAWTRTSATTPTSRTPPLLVQDRIHRPPRREHRRLPEAHGRPRRDRSRWAAGGPVNRADWIRLDSADAAVNARRRQRRACRWKNAHASSAKSTSWLVFPKRSHRPPQVWVGFGQQCPIPTAL